LQKNVKDLLDACKMLIARAPAGVNSISDSAKSPVHTPEWGAVPLLPQILRQAHQRPRDHNG
jgi:hypothetical protein